MSVRCVVRPPSFAGALANSSATWSSDQRMDHVRLHLKLIAMIGRWRLIRPTSAHHIPLQLGRNCLRTRFALME